MNPHIQSPDETAEPTAADALRIQVAAVAAQQIALDEREQRLDERSAALQIQDERLALHWDEKRRELEELYARVQAERAAVAADRKASDQAPAQQEMLEAETHVQAERRRLAAMQQKLKQRWRQHWKAKEQRFVERQAEQVALAKSLEQRERNLERTEKALGEAQLRFNGESAVSRIALQESWSELRGAQLRWRHRRGQERAALRVRTCQIEAAAQQIAQARRQLEHDQRAWLTQRQALEAELDGVNTRVEHQRQRMNQQEAQLHWLQEQIDRRQQALAAPTPGEVDAQGPAAVKMEPSSAAPLTVADPRRVAELQHLAEDLEDQRRELVEAWQRVTTLRDRWQAERVEVVAAIEAQGNCLAEREADLTARAEACEQAESALRQRHEELLRRHQEIVARRSQLQAQESGWEHEKSQAFIELAEKEAAAEQHLAELVQLRERWVQRRKKELAILRSERAGADAVRREFAQLRLELTQRGAALDEEKRSLAEKALALEQYRAHVLGRARKDDQAERRLQRLRRRWLTHNAEIIRRVSRERAALAAELAELEGRYEELACLADGVAAAETELTAKQTAWEQAALQTERRQAALAQELRHAEQRRGLAEQQRAVLRDEIERLAGDLLDQPDPPRLAFDRAA